MKKNLENAKEELESSESEGPQRELALLRFISAMKLFPRQKYLMVLLRSYLVVSVGVFENPPDRA